MRPFALAAFLAASAVGVAQIVLKPSGKDAIELKPRTVDVRATLREGVASSVWTYTFANNQRYRGQADFMIAIPKGGVVGGFAYWYQGEKVVARIAEKERAKRIYSAIVARQRDPALVELVGKNTFRVRVFPIDAAADLKVEVTMAQSIPATPTGATFAIPLRSLGKLEKATVRVEGEGKPQTSWGGLEYHNENSNVPDLRVTQAWPRRALHASLRAARSGGAGGFFVLNLEPSEPLRNRRWRLEGPVEDVIEVKGSGDSVLLVGRYRRPGALRAVLAGAGAVSLVLPDAVEPNGPAAKLWAWNRILGSKSRKEVVALSLRHGVPSPFTSWIAIPTEERKRMAAEIARADLANDIARVMPALRRVGVLSPRGRAIVAGIKARARALGVDADNVWDERLGAEVQALEARWEAALAKHGEDSTEARGLLSRIDQYAALGIRGYGVTNHYREIAQSLAPFVLSDRLARNDDAEARRREARLANAAARNGNSVKTFLQAVSYQESRERALEVARAERAGKPAPASRSRVEALAKATGSDPEDAFRNARAEVASDEYGKHVAAVAGELMRDDPDPAVLRREADGFRAEKRIMAANGAQTYSEGSFFSQRTQRFVQRYAEGKADANDQAKEEATFARLAEAAGLPPEANWREAWRQSYFAARQGRDWLLSAARRDRPALAKAEAVLARVEPHVAPEDVKNYQNYGYYPPSDTRFRYLEERRKGEPGEELLQKLYQEDATRPATRDGGGDRPGYPRIQWARDRSERLRALTELDRLDEQAADPQVLARKRELEKKAKELQTRMGDPIVGVDAHRARSVVARMPDGTWLALHRAKGDRWEARFDVPPGIVDGRYTIAVYVDGSLATRTPINVDTAAPRVEAMWEGGRAVVETDRDVRRVTGLTPDGGRLELAQEAPGRFAALAPLGTRFVATDGAHNRSDMVVTPPGKAAGWAGGVTALAQVGGRLWVGTANDGGGFSGDAPDASRPWVKAAVAVGGRLAVRYADGKVLLDGRPLSLPRDATALAADGETLLVGTIGGYFDGNRPVFPPELAGVVVTALLGDGERVWLGTQGRGIAEVDRARGTVTWHDERAGLADDWVTCLGRDERGRPVAGTFVAGAYVLDGGWRPVEGTQGTCVAGVGGGWVATRQGVFRGGRLVDPVEATAFSTDGASAWVGTRKGIKSL